MTPDAARASSAIVAKIDAITALLAQIEQAIAENWPISVMKTSAPAQGSALPAGTTIDLLPAGPADQTNSALGLKTALATYQAELDALNAQLAAL